MEEHQQENRKEHSRLNRFQDTAILQQVLLDDSRHIQDTCHNRRYGVGGYKWRYATELEAKYAHLYNDNN